MVASPKKKKNVLEKIDKIQRTAEQQVYQALLSIAGIEQAKVAAIRLRETHQWNTPNTGHSNILLNEPLISSSTDYCIQGVSTNSFPDPHSKKSGMGRPDPKPKERTKLLYR